MHHSYPICRVPHHRDVCHSLCCAVAKALHLTHHHSLRAIAVSHIFVLIIECDHHMQHTAHELRIINSKHNVVILHITIAISVIIMRAQHSLIARLSVYLHSPSHFSRINHLASIPHLHPQLNIIAFRVFYHSLNQ